MLDEAARRRNFEELSFFRDRWPIRQWPHFVALIEYRFRGERMKIEAAMGIMPAGNVALYDKEWMRSELVYTAFSPNHQTYRCLSRTGRLKIIGAGDKVGGAYEVLIKPRPNKSALMA